MSVTEQKIEDKKIYSVLCEIYPHIMKGVNYRSWAKYLTEIFKLFKPERTRALEIAAGNSAVYKHINHHFEKYIISDQSPDMLKIIREKDIRSVCFDMRAIPFKSEFDFIFSIFDSVNYLMTKEQLSSFFAECKRIMSHDGIFTFDVSLVNNSLRNLKMLNRKGKYKGIEFQQISKFDPDRQIHLNVFEIKIGGKKYRETHKQRIYDFETYFDIIEKNNLVVVACFDCFGFDDSDSESERVQFVLRKK